jgi:hypothetical protein
MTDSNQSNIMKKVNFLKCPRCRCWRVEEQFYNDKGRKIKTCVCCRNLSKKYRDKKRAKKSELKIKMDNEEGENRLNLNKLPKTKLESEEQ